MPNITLVEHPQRSEFTRLRGGCSQYAQCSGILLFLEMGTSTRAKTAAGFDRERRNRDNGRRSQRLAGQG